MALDFPSNPSNGQTYNNYIWSASTGAWRSLNSVYASNALKNSTISTGNASTVPLTVQGYTSQSANLQEWKNSSGAVVSSFNNTGGAVFTDTVSIQNNGITNLRLSSLNADGAIEIGRQDGVASTPYIDFHSGLTNVDYDARIIASGGSGSVAGGKLSIEGKLVLPYQPTFAARSDQATTQGNDVIWNTVDINVGSNYNSSNGRFTAPTNGFYYFHSHGLWNNAVTGDLRIAFYKNNSGYPGMRTIDYKGGAYWLTWYLDTVAYLAAGDYMTVRVEQLTNGLHTDNNYNQFSGYLLG